MLKLLVVPVFALILATVCPAAEIPQAVTNTQVETHPLLSPEDALAKLQLPPGFRATVFASEPEIRQPIGMAFDARGRLWIAENDTYAESAVGYDLKQRDRVLIFEDTNGDGRADSRQIFWDEGHHLTSVEVGFGGVWVLCAPDLLFIPDHNQDDVPDGAPIVKLTGFDSDSIRHNIVNGLKWGPDGWLYGRHGITTTSFVGTPATPAELRTPINCSMWRFHPITGQFEVVTRGTTNSWGHDWDERGELFFINTVIGHFWHAIPGAHLERMFGEDFNPHLYRLMPQAADHYHWNTAEKWSDIRNTGVTSTTDTAGGGHAHCGMMIYQGTNWPEEYRGDIFTLNLHGLRINRDHLQRDGAGFVAQHRPDFATSKDLWFRGVELGHGPDGGVYVLDWSDIGECHENDGIHRTSGRIYKIVYGEVQPQPHPDFSQLSHEDLLQILLGDDAWQQRIARRLLQERSVRGDALEAVRSEMLKIVTSDQAGLVRLRALWGLHSTGGVADEVLFSLLESSDESLRCWSVQLLAQQGSPEGVVSRLQKLAATEKSGLVLQHIASVLQRLPVELRLRIAGPLLQHAEFSQDRHLPLMIWYGIEPAVAANPEQGLALLQDCKMPELQKFISRRITSEYRQEPESVGSLVQLAASGDTEMSILILEGMRDALSGSRRLDPPQDWKQAAPLMIQRTNTELTSLVRELSVTFGDGLAVAELRKVAANGVAPVSARRNAIRALVTSRDTESRAVLVQLLNDRELAVDAIRGLAVIGDEQTPQILVNHFNRFRGHIRPVAIETLASRPEYALVLLTAVEQKKVSTAELPEFYIRQMRSFDNAQLQERLQKLYPEWRHTSAEKEHRANELRELLTAATLAQADIAKGKLLFEKTCAGCHKLHGQGGKLGPDLTGSQRTNLNYLLGNIVDPSAEVAEKFRMSLIAIEDGRVISGVVLQENEDKVVVQTPNEELTILKSDIAERMNSKLSMMPERQLDLMTKEEIVDLFGFLMQ